MTTILKPPPLKEGDLVALVSPAGPLPDDGVLKACAAALEQFGLRVQVGSAAGKRYDYFAGTDEERTADLNDAFRNPEIKAVFCGRGGYGSGRLLPALDYDALRRQPKIFAGFSDLTAVHNAIATHAGLATMHSPTIATAFVAENQKIPPEAVAVYRHLIESTEPLGSVRKRMKWNDPWTLKPGKATGRLVGGNLAVFAGFVGTPYMPPPEGRILLLEDVGEEPYRIDRLVTQLQLSGYLDKVEGIVLGQFSDADPSAPGRLPINEVLPRLFEKVNKPILANFPVGHVPFNASLPLGCRVDLDATDGDLVVTEAFCAG